MADTTDWSNWTFNFYYGEELRSLYMNGVLLEGFRPGIYNANMLFYVSGAALGSLNLIIKRGTTFIFSNNYCNIDGKVERDFFNLGKETFAYDDQYSYLIKCVANKDIIITSDIWGDEFGNQGFLGKDIGDIHIFAKVKYQAKNTTTASISYPEVAIEPYRVTNGTHGRYIKLSGDSDYGTGRDVFDGMPYSEFANNCEGSSAFLLYSFLELGVIRRRDSDTTPLSFNNFVFTGRGLPEYRQSITPGINILAPDFYMTETLKEVVLDIPGISCDDAVYQNASKNISQDIAITTGRSSDLWKVGVPEIDLNEEELFEYNEDSEKKYSCWTDLYYLAVDKKVSNNEDEDVQNVLLYGSDLHPERAMQFKVHSFKMQGPNDYNAEFRSITSAVDADHQFTTSFDPGLDFEVKQTNRQGGNTEGSPFEHQLFDLNTAKGDLSYGSSNPYYAPISPLDVSIANQRRLFNIIKNKPVIPMLLDRLRQELDDATRYSTIIPVALGFRKYVKNGSDAGHWVGEVSTDKIMDSANILSLFDLQFRETKIYPVTIKNSDVYNTLSVIV